MPLITPTPGNLLTAQAASGQSRVYQGMHAASAGSEFGATLAKMLGEAVQTVAQGEATAIGGMQGKASVQQVVEAVMQAEQTVQTMVAVRDKVVGAYLEISRMQV